MTMPEGFLGHESFNEDDFIENALIPDYEGRTAGPLDESAMPFCSTVSGNVERPDATTVRARMIYMLLANTDMPFEQQIHEDGRLSLCVPTHDGMFTSDALTPQEWRIIMHDIRNMEAQG